MTSVCAVPPAPLSYAAPLVASVNAAVPLLRPVRSLAAPASSCSGPAYLQGSIKLGSVTLHLDSVLLGGVPPVVLATAVPPYRR